MKRCNIVLTGNGYINVAADRMKVEDHVLYVYNRDQLVAMADVSIIMQAHISEKGELYEAKN